MRRRSVEASVANALPHFAPLAIFPLVACAAIYGGWWIAVPLVFYALADRFDRIFGLEERNMDPATTSESQLFLYKLSLWLWAVLWPATFVFALWQALVSDHLALWEIWCVAVILTMVGQTVFIVGHELVHRRALWERRLGELLLASVLLPALCDRARLHSSSVGMHALDPGSSPKGLSFWRYLPAEVANNLLGAWRFERRRLTRRQLPVWHRTNAFWRYGVQLIFWYGIILWMGGPWAALVYVVLCANVVFSMKISNYVQHYGLRRIRTPAGRFEPVKPRHAWSAAYKFTNWLYYNMQRHADHHTSNRRYPLLQHHGEAASPQLPGSYIQMNGLALFPKRWFKTIDPLLDLQRAQFYPEIDDWSPYDSRAFAARPAAFDAIAEIHAAAPRVAGWINRNPALLDMLREREFTDLELPEGFLPGPGIGGDCPVRAGAPVLDARTQSGGDEGSARRHSRAGRRRGGGCGARVVERQGLPDRRARDAGQPVGRRGGDGVVARRGGLHRQRAIRGGGGISPIAAYRAAAAAWRSSWEGPLASGEAMPGETLDIRFVYEGTPARHYRKLCGRFRKALRALTRNNLLLSPQSFARGGAGEIQPLDAFAEQLRNPGSGRDAVALARARCMWGSGDEDVAERVAGELREALGERSARKMLLAELREPGGQCRRTRRTGPGVDRHDARRSSGHRTRRAVPEPGARRRCGGSYGGRSGAHFPDGGRSRIDHRGCRRAARRRRRRCGGISAARCGLSRTTGSRPNRRPPEPGPRSPASAGWTISMRSPRRSRKPASGAAAGIETLAPNSGTGR